MDLLLQAGPFLGLVILIALVVLSARRSGRNKELNKTLRGTQRMQERIDEADLSSGDTDDDLEWLRKRGER